MTIKPGPDLGMLMGGVVVEDDVDGLVRRDLGVDHVQEADELLMPVALHVAPDDRPVEHVQGGKQSGRSIAFIVVGHGAETPLLHGQSRLGSVERLDRAFFIDGQDDGVGGRISVEPNARFHRCRPPSPSSPQSSGSLRRADRSTSTTRTQHGKIVGAMDHRGKIPLVFPGYTNRTLAREGKMFKVHGKQVGS